jgi:class 3 adenylate cyclase/pimeloyl-ACP methyl ester carboxylesterase
MPSSSETSPTRSTRELAAIMFSDVAGYTLIMGRDEDKAIRALADHRELLRKLLPMFNGRLIGEIGDGTLSSFHSALDAVNCARKVQSALLDDSEFQLRIGIHVGDVVFQDNTVLGDGVNVASRIHALAPPGGICISDRVYDEIRNKPDLSVKSLGERTLKNVNRPIRVYALAVPGVMLGESTTIDEKYRRGNRLFVVAAIVVVVAAIACWTLHVEIATLARIYVPRLLPPEVQQKIAYCKTSDGIRIAYGVAGKGPPIVISVGLFTHLELGLFSPTYNSAFLKPLVARHTVVQYDGRGFGLSDRGLKDYSVEARLRDLEAVVDALKLDRFALYGISAGCEVVIAYAAQHPGRVTRIVLYAGDVDSSPDLSLSPEQRKTVEAAGTLIVNRWADNAVRELFASYEMPSASEVEKRFFSEVMRESATPEDVAAFAEAQENVDVKPFAAQIRVPTLIIQVRDDNMNPIARGQKVASVIPGARFVIIDGADHIPRPGTAESEEVARLVTPYFDEDLPSTAPPPSF